MKLRNKKTGRVMGLSMAGDIIWVGNYRYNSLAELNEEWEDYEPKEPLIKDEKLRKIIREWAELNAVREISYSEREDGSLCDFTDYGVDDTSIGFAGWMPTLENGKTYTIDELCGEEEE